MISVFNYKNNFNHLYLIIKGTILTRDIKLFLNLKIKLPISMIETSHFILKKKIKIILHDIFIIYIIFSYLHDIFIIYIIFSNL